MEIGWRCLQRVTVFVIEKWNLVQVNECVANIPQLDFDMGKIARIGGGGIHQNLIFNAVNRRPQNTKMDDDDNNNHQQIAKYIFIEIQKLYARNVRLVIHEILNLSMNSNDSEIYSPIIFRFFSFFFFHNFMMTGLFPTWIFMAQCVDHRHGFLWNFHILCAIISSIHGVVGYYNFISSTPQEFNRNETQKY